MDAEIEPPPPAKSRAVKSLSFKQCSNTAATTSHSPAAQVCHAHGAAKSCAFWFFFFWGGGGQSFEEGVGIKNAVSVKNKNS